MKKRDQTTIEVIEWQEFCTISPTLDDPSVNSGIKYFFLNVKKCEGKDIFDMLSAHPNGLAIWKGIHYEGGIAEGYLSRAIISSFKEHHQHEDHLLDLYGSFLVEPNRHRLVDEY